MVTTQSQRSDEQLEAILRETGHWVVNGQRGHALCFAASLQRALERAAEFGASGAMVSGICRLPSDNIVVSPAQIVRLRGNMATREVLPDDGHKSRAAE
jgi:hypothetical protein